MEHISCLSKAACREYRIVARQIRKFDAPRSSGSSFPPDLQMNIFRFNFKCKFVGQYFALFTILGEAAMLTGYWSKLQHFVKMALCLLSCIFTIMFKAGHAHYHGRSGPTLDNSELRLIT